MNELDDAKAALIYEFEHLLHTRKDLLGNAACGRKIHNVIIEYIRANETQASCVNGLRSLMLDSGVLEEDFNREILPEISAFYRAKELIDAGYFNWLKK